MESSKSEILTGGNSNRVLKLGKTVLRDTGVWSPFVHTLLRHLTAAGFNESPVLLEVGEGQERLSFIEGEVGNYPLKPSMQTDVVLVEAARLLRRFHDLTEQVVVPPDSNFHPAVVPMAQEVICHNDFAPYNCVFQNEHLVGIIDFDIAAPGTRLWDVAYAVYRFVPLTTDAHSINCGWQPIPGRNARLKLFCDTYGLDGRDRLIETVIQRLEAMVAYMRATASNLEHIPLYLADLDYIRQHQQAFTEALTA